MNEANEGAKNRQNLVEMAISAVQSIKLVGQSRRDKKDGKKINLICLNLIQQDTFCHEEKETQIYHAWETSWSPKGTMTQDAKKERFGTYNVSETLSHTKLEEDEELTQLSGLWLYILGLNDFTSGPLHTLKMCVCMCVCVCVCVCVCEMNPQRITRS